MPPLVLNLIVGLACTLCGVLIALYVHDVARKVFKEELAELRVHITRQIASSLSEFKTELIEDLDKTYRRSGECVLITEALHDRIDVNDERQKVLDSDINTLVRRIRKEIE